MVMCEEEVECMLDYERVELSNEKNFSMKKKVYSYLKDYVKIAKEIYGDKLLKVILYGSYARGDFNEDSDIDLLFLVDAPPEKERQGFYDFLDKAFDIKLESELDFQPIVKSVYTFEHWKEYLPFYRNIMNEGEVIYAKAC